MAGLRWEQIKKAEKISGIKYPEDFDIDNSNFADKDIAFSDFRLVKGLRWRHICHAWPRRCIKYPAGFDIDNAKFSSTDCIYDSDFRLVKGFRWRHIKYAIDSHVTGFFRKRNGITGIHYPADFDIENADFADMNIVDSDFSLVKGLRWRHIKNAVGDFYGQRSSLVLEGICGIHYPAEFDIENVDFAGRTLSDSDFRQVEGLRWRHIQNAKSIEGIAYPAEFDIENAGFDDENISGSDFRLVKGLRRRHMPRKYWFESRTDGIKYPAEFDIDTNDFYRDRTFRGCDFRLVKGLRWRHIRDAYHFEGIAYPAEFNIRNADFAGKDISGSDFRLVKGLRWRHIRDANYSFKQSIDYRRSQTYRTNFWENNSFKYPAEFDIENADFSGRDISGSDFRLLGIRSTGFEPVIFEKDRGLSGFEPMLIEK